jgi:hypothetical protein
MSRIIVLNVSWSTPRNQSSLRDGLSIVNALVKPSSPTRSVCAVCTPNFCNPEWYVEKAYDYEPGDVARNFLIGPGELAAVQHVRRYNQPHRKTISEQRACGMSRLRVITII